jgi:hypothetical protein
MDKVNTRRIGRDTKLWGGAVWNYERFSDVLSKEKIEDGLHSLEEMGEVVDFYFKGEGAKSLAVFFHGAVRGPAIPNLTLPVFSGLKIPLGFSADRLLLSDATMAVSNRLRLGWFSGTTEFDLSSRIDSIIGKLVEAHGYERVVMLGGSQGGFAALRASRRLPGSVALIWNPQTRIREFFFPNRVSDFAQLCFGVKTFDEIPEDIRSGRELDLVASYGDAEMRNYVFYMQNLGDPEHLADHATPFTTALARQPLELKFGLNRIHRNAVMAVGHWVGGHSLPDRDTVTAVAGKLLDPAQAIDRIFDDPEFEKAIPASFSSLGPVAPRREPRPSPPPPPAAVKAEGRQPFAADEVTFVENVVEQSPKRWFVQYGISGIARRAINWGVDHVTVIDSDKNRLRQFNTLKSQFDDQTVRLLHADVGSVNEFGHPVDAAGSRRWPAYVMKPWYSPPNDLALPDVVVVDGSFRTACCLNVALRTALNPAVPKPRILLRQFAGEDGKPEILASYFQTIESVGSLTLLQPLTGVDSNDLLRDLSIQIMNPV